MNGNRWLLAGFAAFLIIVIVMADTGWGDSLLNAVHAIPLGDKICHAIFMGTLCWLANRSFLGRPVARALPWLTWPTLIVAALVLAEELSQIWIPGRTFSSGDLWADAAGILCAAVITRRRDAPQTA